MTIIELLEGLVAQGATPEMMLAMARVHQAAAQDAIEKRRIADSARQARKRGKPSTVSHVTSRDMFVTESDSRDPSSRAGVLDNNPPRDSLDSEISEAKASSNITVEEAFKTFYAAYPLKKAPRKAEEAFRRAWKRVGTAHPLETLLIAVEAYIAAKPPFQNYAYPASWLNGDRWKDEPEPPGGSVHDEGL